MINVPGSVLVAGSANIDMVVRAARIPLPGETVLGGDLAINPGGKGANQAVACARAGGAATAMLLALGDDVFAPVVKRSLTDAGVALHLVPSDRPTGTALITVSDDAENAITVASGANATLAPEHLPSLDGVAVLMLQLETPIETIAAYAAAAHRAGTTVILNAAPARRLPESLLRDVDILIVNESELAAIAGDGGSIAEQLRRTGASAAIVTLGERGSCAWTGSAFVMQPSFPVAAIDTTAAGDTFCGAFAAALSHGEAMLPAMRFASAAAALSATRHGAQPSIPMRDEVHAMLLPTPANDDAARVALGAYIGLPAPAEHA